MNSSGLKDDGTREVYPDGAVREAQKAEKGRYDLIPPLCEHRLAVHYARGAGKYADRNWERGLPLSRYVDSGKRHMNQYLSGDRSEDHLAAVIWNACGLMWTEDRIQRGLLPAELADLPDVLVASRSSAEASVLKMRTPAEALEQIGGGNVRDAVLGDPHAATDAGQSADAADLLVATYMPYLPYGQDRDSLVSFVRESLLRGVSQADILAGWGIKV